MMDALLATFRFAPFAIVKSPNVAPTVTLAVPTASPLLFSVPPEILKAPASCEIVVALKVPPEREKFSRIDKLFTAIVPVLNVIVGVPAKSGITTSSPVAGTTLPTQLLGAFQLPPAALLHVIVASSARSSSRSILIKRRLLSRRADFDLRLLLSCRSVCHRVVRFELGMVRLFGRSTRNRKSR